MVLGNHLGQGGWDLGGIGHFDKHFIKNTRKIGSTVEHFGVYLLDTLKTTF